MKPEKKEILRGYNDYVSDYEHGCDSGWNSAIDAYEAWLKEEASVEKIEECIKKNLDWSTDMIYVGESHIWSIKELAKEIHKLIGK